MGFFDKIKNGLQKTRNNMVKQVETIIGSFTKIDEEFFEELEESLIMSDVGVETSVHICEILRERVKERAVSDPAEVKGLLKEIITEMVSGGEKLTLNTKPSIIMMIGVNGAGKTTTIGKLAANLRAINCNVVLAAADTFRAAAIEQLEVWSQRADVDMVKHKEGSDPAAVIFDAINAGKSRNADVIICDTAGRLHTKKNLMDELAKISRVIERELPNAAKEILLVLDATTGQNAVNQAQQFQEVAGITGIVLTKLDSTARGGIIIAIKDKLGLPVKYVGVGEGIDDLQPFDAQAFADALFDD